MGFRGAPAKLSPGYPVFESLPDPELAGVTNVSLTPTETLSLGDCPGAPVPCHMDRSQRNKQMLSKATVGLTPNSGDDSHEASSHGFS